MRNTVSKEIQNKQKASRLVRLALLGYRVIRQLSLKLSFIAEVALAFMMFLTAADVLLRYLFNRPIAGAYELTEYAMAVFIGTGIAYCGILKGHVDVDILVGKLRPRVQAIFAVFTGLLSLGLFALITWNTFVLMQNVRSLDTTSPALVIPVFPFIALVGAGCGLLTLVIFVGVIESVYKAIKT
jgi:TRAP-type C4-dicarboxylate transport system permease small subunit